MTAAQNRFLITPFFLDQPLPHLATLAESDWRINEPLLPEGDAQERMSVLHRRIAEFVSECVTNGHRPVSIAGDCCSTIGVLAGLQKAGLNATLIWLDAHGDFNTWETTPGGFLGGMPLAMAVGRGEQRMPRAVGLRSFPESQVILSDARDLDPGEKEALAASGIHHLKDARTVPDHPPGDAPLYVHVDVDVINPDDVPAVSYLAKGGASASEMEVMFGRLAATGRVMAVSLSAWNPAMDPERRTESICMKLLGTLLRQS